MYDRKDENALPRSRLHDERCRSTPICNGKVARMDSEMIDTGQCPSLNMVVAYLRWYLASSDTAMIESPKLLLNASTGKMRRLDAVLTVYLGNHPFLTAIECRDQGRPAGLARLMAFARKCSGTSVHKSILVSPHGFTRAALSRAKELGIHCLSLDQIESFPWLRCDPSSHQLRVHYSHVDLAIITDDGPVRRPESCTLLKDDGDTVPSEDLRDYLFAILRNRTRTTSDMKPSDNVERIRLLPPDLSVVDPDTGRRTRVRQINLVAHSRSETMYSPVLVDECPDTLPDLPLDHLVGHVSTSGLTGIEISRHRKPN